MRRKAHGAFSRIRGKPMERSSVPIWAQTLVPQTREITLNHQIAGCYWSIFLVGEGHRITTRSELEIKDIHIYSMAIFGTIPLLYGQCRGGQKPSQLFAGFSFSKWNLHMNQVPYRVMYQLNACRTQYLTLILSLTLTSIMGLILLNQFTSFVLRKKKEKKNK